MNLVCLCRYNVEWVQNAVKLTILWWCDYRENCRCMSVYDLVYFLYIYGNAGTVKIIVHLCCI